jgi:hypothetical protein
MTENLIEEWGYSPQSTLTVSEEGTCLTFHFNNTVTSYPPEIPTNEWLIPFEEHTISILSQAGDWPETLSVIPGAGWEVVTQSPIEAADWTTTIITICQMLLG